MARDTEATLSQKYAISAQESTIAGIFIKFDIFDFLYFIVFFVIFVQELVAKGWISLGSTESKASHDDANWNLKYVQLLEYGKKHGDYNIPTRRTFVPGETSDNEAEGSDEGEESEEHSAPPGEVASIRLGKWLERQRHGMRTNTLKKERLEKLQKLVDEGLLVVDSVAEGELSWQQHFAALMEYAQTYQHCNVPYGYEVKVEVSTPMKLDASPSNNGQVEYAGRLERGEDNENKCSKTEVLYLGHWLSNQRHAHNRTNRCLRADRVTQLQVSTMCSVLLSAKALFIIF